MFAQLVVDGLEAVTRSDGARAFQPGLLVGRDEALDALFKLLEFRLQRAQSLWGRVGESIARKKTAACTGRAAVGTLQALLGQQDEQSPVAAGNAQQQLRLVLVRQLAECVESGDGLAVDAGDDVPALQPGLVRG